MIGQCRFCSTNQIKAFRSKETWRNWVKKTIYVSFYLIFKQNSSNFPNIYSENAGDNAIYMRYRDWGWDSRTFVCHQVVRGSLFHRKWPNIPNHRTIVAVLVISVINFVTGRWKHVTSFVKTRDWLTGYDVRGRVSFSWPAGCCFKSREAWASALWRWYSWPVWSRFIFSADCTLKPVSWPSTALTTDTSAGSIRVGLRVFWRNLQSSSLASDEIILELGWCDWCFTAEKSVPVRSEEIWRIHLMLLMKKHYIIELAGVTDALQQRSLYQCALMKNAPSMRNPLWFTVLKTT